MMRWFKKLIETARVSGIKDADNNFLPTNDNFFNVSRLCQPIVFQDGIDVTITDIISKARWAFDSGNQDTVDRIWRGKDLLSPPFSTFSIELLNGAISSDYLDSDRSCSISLLCVLVNETLPGVFDMYCLIKNDLGKFNVMKSDVYRRVICCYTESLNSKVLFSEIVNTKIKLRRDGINNFTVNRIVRICDRKVVSSIKPEFSNKIDWSHRWLVRGHWRRCSNLGKDRNGDYCINGFTWVIDHEKGPEDVPIIYKTRMKINGTRQAVA